MKPYYEVHITMVGDPRLTELAVNEELGPLWKFSKIDGDPVLGSGVKCYATTFYKQSRPVLDVTMDLTSAAGRLREAGVEVTRIKIENVILDIRGGT